MTGDPADNERLCHMFPLILHPVHGICRAFRTKRKTYVLWIVAASLLVASAAQACPRGDCQAWICDKDHTYCQCN